MHSSYSESGSRVGSCARGLTILMSVSAAISQGAAWACDHPGTPIPREAAPANASSIIIVIENTAREGGSTDLYFDADGRGQGNLSVNNIGPFRGAYGTEFTLEIKGLRTGHRYCYRIWSRDGRNGCRSQIPSSIICGVPEGGPPGNL